MSTGDIVSTVFKHKICEINEKDESVSKAADTAAIQQVEAVDTFSKFLKASAFFLDGFRRQVGARDRRHPGGVFGLRNTVFHTSNNA